MAQSIHSASTGSLSDDLIQLVGFNLGDEDYGVDILRVQEINRMVDITKVPQAPEFVEGVINLRGTVIPVIDLRSRLGMPQKEHDRQTRIIVAEIDKRTIGFVVDSVSEVIRIPSKTVEPPPPIVAGHGSEYIEGVGKMDDRLLMLIDINKLFSQSEMNKFSQLADTEGRA